MSALKNALPIGWNHIIHSMQEGSALEKHFKFKNFQNAFGFMTQIALESERRNHHPEWRNTYNQVWIKWCSHDQGNQTTKMDYEMAEFCNVIYDQTKYDPRTGP